MIGSNRQKLVDEELQLALRYIYIYKHIVILSVVDKLPRDAQTSTGHCTNCCAVGLPCFVEGLR